MHTAAHGYAHRWTMLNSLIVWLFDCSHDVQLCNPESWCDHITASQLHINLGKGGKDWKHVQRCFRSWKSVLLASSWMEQSKHDNAYCHILLQAQIEGFDGIRSGSILWSCMSCMSCMSCITKQLRTAGNLPFSCSFPGLGAPTMKPVDCQLRVQNLQEITRNWNCMKKLA